MPQIAQMDAEFLEEALQLLSSTSYNMSGRMEAYRIDFREEFLCQTRGLGTFTRSGKKRGKMSGSALRMCRRGTPSGISGRISNNAGFLTSEVQLNGMLA